MKRTPLKTKTPLKAKKPWQPKRKPIKQTVSLKQHKPIKKVGKVGKANVTANKILAERRGNRERTCEIGALGWPEFTNCLHTWPIQNVHRHKRAWYRGDVQLLSDHQQVVDGCQNCHDRIEHDSDLTERVFMVLRGDERGVEPQDDYFDDDLLDTNDVY